MAFRSVFVDAKIANPKTGRAISLNVINGIDTIPYLQSVQISLVRGIASEMSVVFAPPYEKALELISVDNEWFHVGNTLGIRWGYSDISGAMSDWHYGFMLRPEVSFGEEITVTIPATTLAFQADRLGRLRDWAADGPTNFKTIAETIAKRYGMEVEFKIRNSAVETLAEYYRDSFVQGGRTDLQFLTLEAEKVGLRLVIQNQKFIFADPAATYHDDIKTSANFRMYGKIDIAKNEFPLMSFTPTSLGTLFLQDFQGVGTVPNGPNDDPEADSGIVVSADTDTKNVSPSFSAKKTQAAPPSEDGQPPRDMGDVKVKSIIAKRENEDEAGRHFYFPRDGKEPSDIIEAQVSAYREAQEAGHGILVDFSAFALPHLLPGMFVGIAGVGDYFTGNYMLNKVDLKVEAGGADMDCEAFARGFPGVDESLDVFSGNFYSYEEVSEGTLLDFLDQSITATEGEMG